MLLIQAVAARGLGPRHCHSRRTQGSSCQTAHATTGGPIAQSAWTAKQKNPKPIELTLRGGPSEHRRLSSKGYLASTWVTCRPPHACMRERHTLQGLMQQLVCCCGGRRILSQRRVLPACGQHRAAAHFVKGDLGAVVSGAARSAPLSRGARSVMLCAAAPSLLACCLARHQ